VSCKRKKFNHNFVNYLSVRLQEIGIKCWFRSVYNWFNYGQQRLAPYWRGKFVCIESNCKNTCHASITTEPDTRNKIVIVVDLEQTTVHKNKIAFKPKSRGKKRELQALELMSNGISNCESKNVIENQSLPILGNRLLKYIDKKGF
jgi:hypothetical protein